MAETIQLESRGAGPRTGKSTRCEAARRTTFHEDGLHVATLIEYVHESKPSAEFCCWYTAGDSGRGRDYPEAYSHILSALSR